MADIIRTGPMVDDVGLIINNQSNRPPFSRPFGHLCRTYVADVDFTDGEDVSIRVEASPGLMHAVFTGLNGAIKTYVKTAIPDGTLGYDLTLTDPSSFRADIKFEI